MPIMHNIVVGEDGRRSITVFAGGQLMLPVDQDHPNFAAIVGAASAAALGEDVDEQALIGLFDVAATISAAFERLSDRVTVKNGVVLYNDEPCQPGLSDQIMRFMDEGADYAPLVSFMENVMANPQQESREQAWNWFDNHDFSVAADGRVVIYKGVYSDGAGGYRSGFSGSAHVRSADGTETDYVNSYIPYAVGDIVTMGRNCVDSDAHSACSTGLHVGTYRYAQNYGRNGAMLQVLVDPRDVVSVPADGGGEKIRVCRFEIEKIITDPVTSGFYDPEDYPEDDPEVEFHVGDYVQDYDDDQGEIVSISGDTAVVRYENPDFGEIRHNLDDLTLI